MRNSYAWIATLLVVLCLSGAAAAQTQPPAPVDGQPANPQGPGATPVPPGTAPGGAPVPLPLPLPGQAPVGPGTITIFIDPDLLARILEMFRGLAQNPPPPPFPPAPFPPFPPPGQLPPGAQPPLLPPGPNPGQLPGAFKKNERPIPGFPLIAVRGKRPEKGGLIRSGPGLALTMFYIQQGNQPSAVQTLQQTIHQVEAAKQKFPKLKPGKQVAATRAAYNIGVQTLPPGQGAPAPAAPTGSTTTSSPAAPTDSPNNTAVPPPPGGQGGPPPVGQAPGLPPDPGKGLPVPPIPPGPPKPMPVNPAFSQAVAAAQKQSSPIVLDLNGNGVADVTTPDYTGDRGAFVARGAVRFDISGQGEALRFEWLKPHADGLLVLDANGNGRVDSATELFGDADGFADGYAKLALLDRNGDRALSGAELSRLSVWVDDGDGVCESGELTSVEKAGITRIDVTHRDYVSSFVQNGAKHQSWDWFPRSE